MTARPFQDVYIEITSRCNARCRWCDTGMRKNGFLPSLAKPKKTFMHPQMFYDILLYLKTKKIITFNACVYPFNFSDPFTHPNALSFIAILEKLCQPYILSTNAFVVPVQNADYAFTHMQTLVFSMPGFSDASYKKIHGIPFKKIIQNIQSLLNLTRQRGFKGRAEIHFHSYTFNQGEEKNLCDFAFTHGMLVRKNVAVPLSTEIVVDYLSGSLRQDVKEALEEDIFVDKLKESMEHRPSNFQCNAQFPLTISSQGEVLSCCWVSENLQNNAVGSIFTHTLESIKDTRRQFSLCKPCIKLKADYFLSGWHYRTLLSPPCFIASNGEKFTPYLADYGLWLWDKGQEKRTTSDNIDKQERNTLHVFLENYATRSTKFVDVDFAGKDNGDTALFVAKQIHARSVHVYKPSVLLSENITQALNTAKLNVHVDQCLPFYTTQKNEQAPAEIVRLNFSQCQEACTKESLLAILNWALDYYERWQSLLICSGLWDIPIHFYGLIQTFFKQNGFYLYTLEGEHFKYEHSNCIIQKNVLLTRHAFTEVVSAFKNNNLSLLQSKQQACCNICANEWYGKGPNGRLGKNGHYPRCLQCLSLERHRAHRQMWNTLQPLLSNLNVLQFSHDVSADPSHFTSIEVSVYGGCNSLDLQNINKSDNSYDLVICNQVLEHVEDDRKALGELLRIVGTKGIVQISVPNPLEFEKTEDYGFANEALHGHYRHYGADIWTRFADSFFILSVLTCDIVTDTCDIVFFIAKEQETLIAYEKYLQDFFEVKLFMHN